MASTTECPIERTAAAMIKPSSIPKECVLTLWKVRIATRTRPVSIREIETPIMDGPLSGKLSSRVKMPMIVVVTKTNGRKTGR